MTKANEGIEDLGKEALEKLGKGEGPNVVDVVNKRNRGEELTPEEAVVYAAFSQKKAKVAQIMTRGVINDKLQALIDKAVPEGRVGKFVRDNDDDIVRYKNLEWDFIYKEDAPKGLHSEADGRIRVGDVVLMTIAREDLLVLSEAKRERVGWKLGAGKEDYLATANQRQAEGVTSFDGSSQKVHKSSST